MHQVKREQQSEEDKQDEENAIMAREKERLYRNLELRAGKKNQIGYNCDEFFSSPLKRPMALCSDQISRWGAWHLDQITNHDNTWFHGCTTEIGQSGRHDSG